MYEGTMVLRESAAARCRAPNTANGAAKHRLFRATILSRPLARAKSDFATQSAMRMTRTPALHIKITVRENTRIVARIIVCMWRASIRSSVLNREGYHGQQSVRLDNEQ